ncbi:MAG: carbohydrate ABC transporter permease [Cetobacterium sp.]|uniref:carbohydrate ABC transporter permease n=1 Tax=Cetobacterium sp. ZWU0022 TaxID=1340502 RepID=UPI00064664ED|nr:carbohydrate ABC transporter permease [Cetobacterium sp. ZWU0022]
MKKTLEKILKISMILIVVFYGAISIFPFIWSFITSLKPTTDVNTFNIPFSQLSFKNYSYIFKNFPFVRWLLNSIIVAGLVTAGNILFNSMAGYALARIEFPGKKSIFVAILGMMMIPGQVVMVPTYIILVNLGWINSYYGLTIPFMFNFFNIFLMRQFFMGIPKDLEEAGYIDGLSRFGIFFRVILPVSKSALSTQFILSFTGNWNSFLWPTLIGRKQSMYTLPVGLNSFYGQYFQFWDQVLAGVMLLSIPAILIFIIFQKHFIAGIANSGSKE